jgi:hypothetical protein
LNRTTMPSGQIFGWRRRIASSSARIARICCEVVA